MNRHDSPDASPDARADLTPKVRALRTVRHGRLPYALIDLQWRFANAPGVDDLRGKFSTSVANILSDEGLPYINAEEEREEGRIGLSYHDELLAVLQEDDSIAGNALDIALDKITRGPWPPKERHVERYMENAADIVTRAPGGEQALHREKTVARIRKALPSVLYADRSEWFLMYFGSDIGEADIRQAAETAVRLSLNEPNGQCDLERVFALMKEYGIGMPPELVARKRRVLACHLTAGWQSIHSLCALRDALEISDGDMTPVFADAMRSLQFMHPQPNLKHFLTVMIRMGADPVALRPNAIDCFPLFERTMDDDTLFRFIDFFGLEEHALQSIPGLQDRCDMLDDATRQRESETFAQRRKELQRKLEQHLPGTQHGHQSDRLTSLALMLHIKRFGIDAADTVQAWKTFEKPLGETYEGSMPPPTVFARNLSVLHEMEALQPGATAVLQKEFGIRHFGRYDLSLLCRQYNERHDRSRRYGVVVSAISDPSGASMDTKDISTHLMEDAGKCDVYTRFIEAGSRKEALQRLLTLKKRYRTEDGENDTFAFIIVHCHGSKHGFTLGDDGAGADLHIGDLTNVSSANRFLGPRDTLILNSCSTGQEDGVAQELSRKTKAIVIAPDMPTSISSFSVTKGQKNSVQIMATYTHGKRVRQVFVGGENVTARYQNAA